MKTFFLLIAVVFLTIQVQAQTTEEEMLTTEEAVTELPSMETEGSDIMASDPQQRKVIVCYCRRLCFFLERNSGTCRISGVYYRLCCR
ncbi:defensin-A2-like [Trichosurus vulpecula]|uniref:defensin-A2-like n=1 Tax=Trichosurus vulpecula TaxID=9337 RepID=UPI00186B3398|nr:defensin-A2-like [Trichosurus vulpecula]